MNLTHRFYVDGVDTIPFVMMRSLSKPRNIQVITIGIMGKKILEESALIVAQNSKKDMADTVPLLVALIILTADILEMNGN